MSDKFVCYLCKEKNINARFDNELAYNKHYWGIHPVNKYEKEWSKHYKNNFKDWKGSSYYESFGPYY